MEYVKFYKKENSLKTKDNKEIKVFNLKSITDENVLNEWADNFRKNYRTIEDLDFDIEGTGKTREEYLINDVFPDKKIKPGPSTRVGDFCELLVADYIQYIDKYYVPRTRYCRKVNRNMSTPGSDVLGFKIDDKVSCKDEIFVIEVKGTASIKSKTKGYERLQDAIDDSQKDIIRYAESLNAVKRRLKDVGEKENALKIQRFQNYADKPYAVKYGASAVLTDSKFIDNDMKKVIVGNDHKNPVLIVIHHGNLSKLIDELYRRAAIC